MRRTSIAWLALATGLLLWGGGCEQRARARPDAGALRTGSVRVESVPAGAAVLLGGRRRVGHTPLTLERQVGTRLDLSLVKDGYGRERRTVVIEAGHTQRLVVSFERERELVIVRSGAIRGARVLIDGRERGRTPIKVWLEPGPHSLRVEREGMHPYTKQLIAGQGGQLEVQALLVPAGRKIGYLSVSSDVPALVKLNGVPLGKTPLERLPLPVRRHELLLEPDKPLAPRRLSVRIVAGKHRELTVNLRR